MSNLTILFDEQMKSKTIICLKKAASKQKDDTLQKLWISY